MTRRGPSIAGLVRRLAETPAEFLAEPRIGSKGVVHVDALVADLVRDLGGPAPSEAELEALRASARSERARLRLTLVAAWLLHDDWFVADGRLADAAFEFLARGLAELAETVDPARFVTDGERAEELARLTLKALGLLPDGETAAQAQDRLTTVSTLERRRVLGDLKEAQERVRKVQEAMRRKQAEEAAASYSRE